MRATFFALGRQVRAHPEIARRIVAEGHELASHGDDHSLLTFAGPDRRSPTSCARWTSAVVDATGGAPAPLFRAPHGFRSPFLVPVARRLGYRVVGWTAGVWDTAKPGVDADRRPQRVEAAAGRDPAPARRRRLRQRRRPVADGRRRCRAILERRPASTGSSS